MPFASKIAKRLVTSEKLLFVKFLTNQLKLEFIDNFCPLAISMSIFEKIFNPNFLDLIFIKIVQYNYKKIFHKTFILQISGHCLPSVPWSVKNNEGKGTIAPSPSFSRF